MPFCRLKCIDKPNSQPIRVAHYQVRLCPAEIRETSSEGRKEDKQTKVGKGVSTTDGNVMGQSESGDASDSDPEEGEARVDTAVQELETVDITLEPKSPLSSMHHGENGKEKNTWSRRLHP